MNEDTQPGAPLSQTDTPYDSELSSSSPGLPQATGDAAMATGG